MLETAQNKNSFIVRLSEIENRLEAEYYRPAISSLEKTIRGKTTKKLKSFIQKIASGATPSIEEEEKYYSTKGEGVPFLRVQNLQTNGLIDLSEVKYINRTTHNTYLKRSQVAGGDLLVKITGVGRMAIASVAPDNFEGNTNQHMVIIKTESKAQSEYLAKYLNLDLSERLASRRATGATRPALDYKALKSIPVIEGIDFSVLEKAEKLKQQKEAEAKALLASIDDYLLKELGIELPKQDDSLKKRVFTGRFSEVSGGRLDPMLYDISTKELKNSIENNHFEKTALRNLITHNVAGDWGKDETENIDADYVKCLVIRATEFDNDGNLDLNNSRTKYRFIRKDKLKKINIEVNDLLIEKSGGSIGQPVGRVALLTKNVLSNGTVCYSNFIHKIRVNDQLVFPSYLFAFLKTMHNIKLTESMQSQTNGIRNLIMKSYFDQKIILPRMEKQIEIAGNIEELKIRAEKMKSEAMQILEKAKQEVEKMILG